MYIKFLFSIFVLFLVFVEQANAYNICAVMESGFVTEISDGACGGSAQLQNITFAQETVNHPPKITGYNLPRANKGEDYKAIILASDEDGNALNWEIEPFPSGCTENLNCTEYNSSACAPWKTWSQKGWDLNATKEQTSIYGQVGLGFGRAGDASRCFFKATVIDARNTSFTDSKTFYIQSNAAPTIVAGNYNYNAGVGNFEYSFEAYSDDTGVYPLVLTTAGGSDFSGLETALNDRSRNVATFPLVQDVRGSSRFERHGDIYKYSISVPFASADATLPNSINGILSGFKVTDRFGNYAQANPDINLINRAPVISQNCVRSLKVGDPYSCDITITDAENNNLDINFNQSGSYNSLDMTESSVYIGGNRVHTLRLRSAEFRDISSTVSLVVTDEFDAITTDSFTIGAPNASPSITFSSECSAEIVRGVDAFSCEAYVSDADGHSIQLLSVSGTESIDGYHEEVAPNNASVKIRSDAVSQGGSHTIEIKAVDQYGAETIRSVSFGARAYCGSGVIDTPNDGGVMEQCDGSVGLDGYNCLGANYSVASVAASCHSSTCQRTCPANTTLYYGLCAGDGIIQESQNNPEQCECSDGTTSCDIQGKSCMSTTSHSVPAVPAVCGNCHDYCPSGTTAYNGVCGNGAVEGIEQCDCGGDSKDCAGGGSSVNDQYGCTNCRWNGGYLGDSVKNGGEVCDPNLSSPTYKKACSLQFDTGVAHCGADGVIWGQGNEFCKADGSGYEACNALPSESAGSSDECSATSPVRNDYACCELVACSQDGCACGGRSMGAPIPSGYSNVIADLQPVWNNSQVLDSGYTQYTSFTQGPYPGSCKLTRSDTNLRNWKFSTNHSRVSFRCWR